MRGEAGAGKSALLAYVAARTDGWQVATAAGVESEMELAYSGLHQLCVPMLECLDRLPVPQREALATVFGISAGTAPDRFLVGLATLTLFAEGRGRAAAHLHRRRRAVARPRLGTDSGLRRPTPPRRADCDRVRGAEPAVATPFSPSSRSCPSMASSTRTLARCWSAISAPRSTPRSVIRSWRRATGTRSRCWSCPGRGTRPSWRRFRVSRWSAGGRQDRTELRPTHPRAPIGHSAVRPGRSGGAVG